jgi:hypothetical protein
MEKYNFAEMDDATLADLIGTWSNAKKAAEKRLTELRAEADARGKPVLVGRDFEVTFTEQMSSRLDIESVKQFLGAARVARFMVDQVATFMRVKPAIAAGAAVVPSKKTAKAA